MKHFQIATQTPIDTVQCSRHCKDPSIDIIKDSEHIHSGLEDTVSNTTTNAGHLNYLSTISYLKTAIAMLQGNIVLPVCIHPSTIVPRHKSLLLGWRQPTNSRDKTLSTTGWRQSDEPVSDKSLSIVGWRQSNELVYILYYKHKYIVLHRIKKNSEKCTHTGSAMSETHAHYTQDETSIEDSASKVSSKAYTIVIEDSSN